MKILLVFFGILAAVVAILPYPVYPSHKIIIRATPEARFLPYAVDPMRVRRAVLLGDYCDILPPPECHNTQPW